MSGRARPATIPGLICKAADAGYKIIIVLAGLRNNPALGTRFHLEGRLRATGTSAKAATGSDPVGVAAFGEDLKTNSATTRANGVSAGQIAKHWRHLARGRPRVFVVRSTKSC